MVNNEDKNNFITIQRVSFTNNENIHVEYTVNI